MTVITKSMFASAVFALSTGIATAGPTSPVVSAEVAVEIGVSKTATISMKALGPFPEQISRSKTVVAEGEASSTDAKVAIRWAQGQPNMKVNEGFMNNALITGRGGEVGAFVLEGSDGPMHTVSATSDGWFVMKDKSAKFTVLTNGNTIVKPDSYPVVIEAVAWSS